MLVSGRAAAVAELASALCSAARAAADRSSAVDIEPADAAHIAPMLHSAVVNCCKIHVVWDTVIVWHLGTGFKPRPTCVARDKVEQHRIVLYRSSRCHIACGHDQSACDPLSMHEATVYAGYRSTSDQKLNSLAYSTA